MFFEFVFGYGLFEANGIDEIEQSKEVVQGSIFDFNRFGKVVKMIAIHPFSSETYALNHFNVVFERLIGKRN